jgi:hypothetical protein
MNLAIGQVWINDAGERALVVEVRDEEHPRGHGYGFGDTAIAAPIHDRQPSLDPLTVHPFDTIIICAALEHHGPKRWRFVDQTHYLPSTDGIFYLYPGAHPVPGDDQ